MKMNKLILSGRGADLGFMAVVIASYISAVATFSYIRPRMTEREILALIVAGVTYVLVGTVGFAWCKRSKSFWTTALYFLLQLSLVVVIFTAIRWRGGPIWLIPLPLASQAVVRLPRPWMLLMCLLVLATVLGPIVWSGSGIIPIIVVGVMYLAGIVFVAVFTQIAVNENRARAEIEVLAGELSRANRKLSEYAAQAEELATVKERNRLAREIHDSLGHYLTTINVQTQAARAMLESDRTRALDALGKAQSLAQEGLAEVRRSITALRAAATESRPLPEAVATLVEECRAAGMRAELAVTGHPRALAPQAELTFYRAAQEALTNVRKHARASCASLSLDYAQTNVVRLTVQDDGIGAGESDNGFGLLGVRERAQLLGGEVCIRTAIGQGFTLEVELPG